VIDDTYKNSVSKNKMHNILLYDEGAQGDTQLGGGQLIMLNIFEKLNRDYFFPALLTSTEGELAREARRRNIPVYVERISEGVPRFSRHDVRFNPISLIKYVYTLFFATSQLLGFLKKNDVDLIVPNENLSRVIAALSSKFIKIPIVSHIDGEWNKGRIDDILRFLYIRSFDTLIAASYAVLEPFNKNSRSFHKIRTINPGIDLDAFNPKIKSNVRIEFSIPHDSIVLGIVGKLDEIKGHKYLFKALQRIQAVHPGVKCLVVGVGPYETELKKQTQEFGLEDVIIFTGYRHDIPQVMKAIDILACSSLTEAFPLVIIEAMAMGKPVIGTNVGGISEALVDGENGFLIPPKDVEALILALQNLIRDKDLRVKMGASGMKRARSNFSIELTVTKITAIYLELLEVKSESPTG
jgi:glycosyltransferase involved in cell wall biosynthesis